jgi:hypothetical protein
VKLREFVGLIVAVMVTLSVSAQRIVDQTEINPFEPVQLFGPLTFHGFDQLLGVNQLFPDFETIDNQLNVKNRDQILLESIQCGLVPVFVFGRPSCPAMRALYSELIIPAYETDSSIFTTYHLENSVEAHATDGYLTPYYFLNQGVPNSVGQIPDQNLGLSFGQPLWGSELLSSGVAFVSIMESSGVAGIEQLQNLTILLDDPQGGFTNYFGGPSLIWVVNPITGETVFEETGAECVIDPNGQECFNLNLAFHDAIQDVKLAMESIVSVQEASGFDEVPYEFEPLTLLGVNSNSGLKIYYNPYTKQKLIKLAQ